MEIIQVPVNVQERAVKFIHQVVSMLHFGKVLANIIWDISFYLRECSHVKNSHTQLMPLAYIADVQNIQYIFESLLEFNL